MLKPAENSQINNKFLGKSLHWAKDSVDPGRTIWRLTATAPYPAPKTSMQPPRSNLGAAVKISRTP